MCREYTWFLALHQTGDLPHYGVAMMIGESMGRFMATTYGPLIWWAYRQFRWDKALGPMLLWLAVIGLMVCRALVRRTLGQIFRRPARLAVPAALPHRARTVPETPRSSRQPQDLIDGLDATVAAITSASAA